jgi:hypothetical protein
MKEIATTREQTPEARNNTIIVICETDFLSSPLGETLKRYADFFRLFENFHG